MKPSIDPQDNGNGDTDRLQTTPQRNSAKAVAGGWILLIGRSNLTTTALNIIARLEESGPVRVLDGGNQYHANAIAGKWPAQRINRTTVARAFSCEQMLSLLESTPATEVPLVILDLLAPFYDESVRAGYRKRLLEACIHQLKRLEAKAGTLISVHMPEIPSTVAFEMLKMVKDASVDTFFVYPATPAPEPMRLF
jgi:hypothetical protein